MFTLARVTELLLVCLCMLGISCGITFKGENPRKLVISSYSSGLGMGFGLDALFLTRRSDGKIYFFFSG